MDAFALETPATRAEAFIEAAARMGVQPIIIEKDFWVCWTLKRIFSGPALAVGLIFKGGTSLSKGYGVIERFSEDIDLSLNRHDLGFAGDKDPASAELSIRKRKELLEDLQATSEAFVSGELKDHLTESFAAVLGGAAFDLSLDDQDPQTLIFSYPQSLTNDAYKSDYLKPPVRLEFGARSDHVPAETRSIEPYINRQIPDLIADPATSVNIIGAERTFWDKATILHKLFHMEREKPLGDRMSRHYYDLAMLINSPIKDIALADMTLLDAVAQHTSVFFKAAWARFETAKPGTLRLSPHTDLEKILRADYAKMSEMIFNEPPSFDNILRDINALETQINTQARPA